MKMLHNEVEVVVCAAVEAKGCLTVLAKRRVAITGVLLSHQSLSIHGAPRRPWCPPWLQWSCKEHLKDPLNHQLNMY